eukprot:scaffold17347_cov116-Isochrysis_galbana.AAC.7
MMGCVLSCVKQTKANRKPKKREPRTRGSDPSAPMGPREDIFSTFGAPESRMNTMSTSAATSAQICRKP